MIIACPACATRYVVPDSAIGAEGRTVRCAKCRHSWYQDGPALEMAEAPPASRTVQVEEQQVPIDRAPVDRAPDRAPAEPDPVEHEPFDDEPAEVEPVEQRQPAPPPPPHRQAPIASEAPAVASAVENPPVEHAFGSAPAWDESPAPTVVEAAAAPDPEPEYGEEISQFDYAPPFRPRRNMLKIWTVAAALFAFLALATVAAVSYWGLPDWVPISRPTFALGQPDLVLDFPRAQQERRTLPNGTEYFGASGTVKNVGRETRTVPSILIVLRDARERIVYSWEIAPPKPRLAPGETVTINEAVTDVPRSAKFAEIGWKPN